MKNLNNLPIDNTTLNLFLTSLLLILFGIGIATYSISTIIYSLCIMLTGG